MNPYDVLGVNKNATEEEIKKAYRKLVMDTHPDKNIGDKESVEKFKRVQEAYDILGDSSKRSEYDRFGTVNRKPFNGMPPQHAQNIWEEIFGGNPDKGRSIQVRVDIDLKEALFGTKKTIKTQQKGKCNKCDGKGFTTWEACETCSGSGKAYVNQHPFNIFMPCPVCQGTGRKKTVNCPDCLATGFTPIGDKFIDVEIPIGADTGMQIRVAGEGEPGRRGARSGDLFVVIVVKEHELYIRQGNILIVEVPLSYSQLVLGCGIEIPTLDGGNMTFAVPPGTQNNTKFVMKNMGMPDLRGKRGDLVACVKVEIPQKIPNNYQKVIEDLVQFEQQYVTPKCAEFIKKTGNKK